MAQNKTEPIFRMIYLPLGMLFLCLFAIVVLFIISCPQMIIPTETKKNPLTSEISVITKNSIVTINLTNSHTKPILVTLTYITSNCTHIKVTPRNLTVILPPDTATKILVKVEKQTMTTCNLTFRLSETLITKRSQVTPTPYGYSAIVPATYGRGVEEGEEGIRGGGEIGGEVGEGISVGEG